MGVSEYNRFQNDFPDRIKGEIIKEDNLLNVLNALYDNLGKDIENISQVDEARHRPLLGLCAERFKKQGRRGTQVQYSWAVRCRKPCRPE